MVFADKYLGFDAELASGERKFDRAEAIVYAQGLQSHPEYAQFAAIHEFSMLHPNTLAMCRAFALEARGGVIEIGPYVGGSTAAMAMGIRQARSGIPLVSVEVGGAYRGSTSVASEDIHADWAKNLDSLSLGDIPTLVKGYSYGPGIFEEVERALDGRKADLFFIDADGNVERHLTQYRPLLSDNALIILDDYFNVIGLQAKTDVCAAQIHKLMGEGALEQYVLIPWSTWFGRLGVGAE